jgi:3-phenylpropionate/trans-cinnamate dioxygenase ferredoxin subunit
VTDNAGYGAPVRGSHRSWGPHRRDASRLRGSPADAWREERSSCIEAVDVGPASEIFATNRALVTIDSGTAVLLIRDGHRVFALRDRCPHMGRSLGDGTVRRQSLTCRHHGRRYSLRSGSCLSSERSSRLTIYPAWIEGGHVFVAFTPPDSIALEPDD